MMNSPATTGPFPLPQIDATNRPYWDGLRAGRLSYPQCDDCGHAWLPPRTECPHCLGTGIGWKTAGGQARLVSWVVYHKPFHPAFTDRVPYNVAVVELEEGPRLISNIVGTDNQDALRIDLPLELMIEDEHGIAVPRFRIRS